jgi:hypothetical protein
MKILPVGAQMFHTDRQTDRPEAADGGYLQFCEYVYKVKYQQHFHTS